MGRLDYVEPGFKRFQRIESRWDRLESVGHVAHLLPPGHRPAYVPPSTDSREFLGAACGGRRI